MNELKQLIQLPLAMATTKLIWKGLSKKEKDELLNNMWVAIVMAENPLLAKGVEYIYDWCVNNYE